MERILIVGSPGSGKSTLAKKMADILGYNILHLDYIFHIDNYNSISREELKTKIAEFVNLNKNFIIDGNYLNTMEFRMGFADTIILLDISSEICLNNVLNRIKSDEVRTDIAPRFDNSIMDMEFIDYVKNFSSEQLPRVYELINNNDNINKVIIRNYEELKEFINSLKYLNKKRK